MRSLIPLTRIFTIMLVLCPLSAMAQSDELARSWNRPVKPFRVIGNIYYVGASDITSFLITTTDGHILLDSGFAETVPIIQQSVKQLGFKLEDVRILINSHGHYDHAGGFAELKKLTGARLMLSEAEARLISRGGKGDFQWGDKFTYASAEADQILHDQDQVRLGGVVLTAHLTPGHTKGSTTWTMKVAEEGKQYDVVFANSTTAPGYALINKNYPDIAADYARTFRVLKSLPCDVFLAPHGSFFSLQEKMQRAGENPNPFIDPAGYRKYIETTEKAFRENLEKQESGQAQSRPS